MQALHIRYIPTNQDCLSRGSKRGIICETFIAITTSNLFLCSAAIVGVLPTAAVTDTRDIFFSCLLTHSADLELPKQ